jgi:hypothetical protein
MTEQPAVRQRLGSNVLLGSSLGAVLAIVIGVLPASGYVLAPVLLVALAAILVLRPIRYSRLAGFGGVLVGAGALFLYGVVNTVVACARTSDFCGQANVLPLFAVAVVMLGTGGLVAAAASKHARG